MSLSMSQPMTTVTILSLAVLGLAFGNQSAWGQVGHEMHLETFIYVDGQKDPVSENVTLFTGGKVFDFRLDPKTHEPLEVVVYDPARQRFELIDPVGNRRTTIAEADVLELLAAMATNQEVTRRDPMLYDAAGFETLTETYDATTGWLSLKSSDGRLEYRARGERPRNPDALAPFCQFTDWYARLNGTDASKMPPFARLALNQRFLKHGILPSEIQLTYSPPGLLGRKVSATAKHYTSWSLTRADRERIEKLNRWTDLPRVEVATYLTQDSPQR